MKAAVIDIGTNTFHLLIAEGRSSGIYNFLHQETIPVKLGEGGITKGILTDAAIERGIAAIKKFKGIIEDHQISSIKIIATAAVRSASNGQKFIDRVYTETGLKINIVNGNEEAELIYTGVKWGLNLKSEKCLIMDIGGGSVEFIICNSTGLIWKKSYPIGAAKLMALYHRSDPISPDEIKTIQNHLDEILVELQKECALHSPQLLIGSSGAFETFAELLARKFAKEENPHYQKEFEMNVGQFKEMASELLRSTHNQRASNPAIIPVRVDMIIVSTVLTLYILDKLQLTQLKLSAYALKEGALFHLLN
ncbi:Ppx/GppA phosphatase family protein [Daejeonella oryzae]|uniref:Ppx/GppA phosphatase family protein n=1 Tax=Daejeonella oryzae TaxID=1122943 RepID=UPI0004259201|nr:hypothetical protein [Daejeonella oryzae]